VLAGAGKISWLKSRNQGRVHPSITEVGMGKLLEMPIRVLPYAICAMPSRSGGPSKFVLLTSSSDREDVATVRGFVRLAELIAKMAEMGVSSSIQKDVRVTLEAGSVYNIPRLLLSPPVTSGMQSPRMGTAL
jgi:hypothetical protein